VVVVPADAVEAPNGILKLPVTLKAPVTLCVSVKTLPNLTPLSKTCNSVIPPIPTVIEPVTSIEPLNDAFEPVMFLSIKSLLLATAPSAVLPSYISKEPAVVFLRIPKSLVPLESVV